MSLGDVTWSKKSPYSVTWNKPDIVDRVSGETFYLSGKKIRVTDICGSSEELFYGSGKAINVSAVVMSAEAFFGTGKTIIATNRGIQ